VTTFASALHRGLGRALRDLKTNRATDSKTRRFVLDACLNNRAYDPQIEGPRVEYLLEAAQLVELISVLIPHLQEALLDVDGETDHWSLQQRVDLLVALCQQGRTEAEAAFSLLYSRYQQADGPLLQMLEEAQLNMHGAVGLLQVLHDRIQRSGERPGDWDEDLLQQAERVLAPDVLHETLRMGRNDPSIRAYLDEIGKREQRQRRRGQERFQVVHPPIDFDEARRALQDALARNADGCSPVLLSSRLTEEALARLARDLEQETDPETLHQLLCAFVGRTFPGPPTRLLALASHPDIRVAERSVIALSRLQHPEVKALAIRLLDSDGPLRLLSAKLLRLNFEAGDACLLRRVLETTAQVDDDLWHVLCRDIREIAEAYPAPDMLDLLADTYPHQPCSHCRHTALDVLVAHSAVPRWLRHEAGLDANTQTRHLMGAVEP